MTQRPPDVRIDDLADPKFSPEIGELRAQMEAIAPTLRLEPDALMAAARDQTGLDDFGDPWFLEPLEVLTLALRDEAGLSPSGTVSAWSQLAQHLKNRLLLEDLLKRHPEIGALPIERPIVIAGLPRTGTTHLHNVMAADPALRSLPYWESLEPVLAPSEAPAPGAPDPRLARTAQAIAVIDSAMPYFKRMHEMTVQHVHEEIQLLAMAGSTMLFETMAPMPSWRDWYRTTDQTPAYAYLKTILQALQWLRGGRRWVLKSPQHLEQFRPLMTVFPDATVVVTHRDPVSVTASMVTMIAYTSRLALATVDPPAIGRYWAPRIEDMLHACVDDRDVVPAQQSIDVRFAEFMRDDVAMVGRIYDLAGQPMTPEARSAMETFMARNPRGRHGRVMYDLGDFGLDPTERRSALAFYSERFAVEAEPPGRG
jgi:Sulfotransferase family